MVTRRDPVQATFDEFGAKLGLEKRARTWYRRSPGMVGILNLQKSQWGAQYYVNVAFWFTALGAEEFPNEREAHVRSRLDAVLGQADAAELTALLDLDAPIREADRVTELLRVLGGELAPLFEKFTSVAAFRSPAGRELLMRALVRREAQPLVLADA
ncbi:hypothetical protein AVP42_02888 [Agromyces sp. NDB4Y10]|uniref:DUF4304 domain-containing protein n=1 Tax=Agromyces sp. NDB4Y10 TaxID=1775951 RepID=UPI0007B18091|nr:DUF4304 domain-containing protein [Agromyces sp. NDB4Y10]KZE92095.1 hypothetical protein AVP42_02888 [Agromyces sp. NDB4Y10]